MSKNPKLDKAREMIHDLEADIVAFNEHRMRLSHRSNINGFRKLFQGGEAEIRAIAAHNVHDPVMDITQEGGTSLMAYGTLADTFNSEHSGKDESGLGRWVSMLFRGTDNVNTRVVCAYQPCYNRNLASGTSYQQQRRYWIETKGDLTCPRIKLRNDLLTQLTKWRGDGERIILCMDANEHIYDKHLGKALTNPDGLNFSEVVGDFTGEQLGATYFRGSKPIDAVWATRDIKVTGACVMPCGYGIGDHRLFVIDMETQSMIGSSPVKIARPATRRLNTRLPKVEEKYVNDLGRLIVDHRLIERLGTAFEQCHNNAALTTALNKLDQEGKEYMLGAERRCRKIRSGCIPFSPETVKWLRRIQVYRALLQRQAGRRKNQGNLLRTARRVGIEKPFQMSADEIRLRLKTCENKCSNLKRTGWLVRRRFLLDRCKQAQEKHDESTVQKILALIKREKDRAFWSRLRTALGKKRGRSVSTVQVEDSHGVITDYNTQEGVQEAIFSEIHRKRFFLAEAAPICNGALRGEFGYLAISPTARAILDGTYNYPDYFDPDTKSLCLACARIRQVVPVNSVATIIKRDEWSRRWKKAKEDTSSSESGLHFGHYRAGTTSATISHFHALKATLTFHRGIVLERWSRGLSVMIEKMFGCSMVSKLRSILLMEADFNLANKTIFGSRMLHNVRKHKLMPDEIFSEKNRTADDGTLAKTIFYDLARQSRRPAGVASVDADNCFDRIAHAMASLCFQAFGVPAEATQTMLSTIQEMKFFLRTAYGDSKAFAGSTIHMKTQGLCQGNGAAPAGWAVVSIVILDAHKQQGHGMKIRCPISGGTGKLAAILFVDDTDLLHINLNHVEHIEETHWALQESITSWGKKLIATGGALKPSKCFYYLIDFDWDENGTWKYKRLSDEDLELYAITVPTADGHSVRIDDGLQVDEARKTLGSMTCPAGHSTAALSRMTEQATAWVGEVEAGKLHRRQVWFMMSVQFWPRVGYGISVNCASLAALEEALRKPYYDLLPMGGIIRSAPKQIRTLDIGFGGAGCPHPGIECLVGQLNKLMMHYGCKSTLGLLLQASMEYFIVELGLSATDPFSFSYQQLGALVTHSWMKSLWEKCSHFRIQVHISNVKLSPPRVRDKWLMQAFIDMGYRIEELMSLNRVRLFQQVLFLSDVVTANGRAVDHQYASARPAGDVWSSINFPQEYPSDDDWKVWNDAIFRTSPMGRSVFQLREFLHSSHRLWHWRHDEVGNRLLHCNPSSGVVEVFEPSTLPGALGRANRWHRSAQPQTVLPTGPWCSVKYITDDVVAMQGSSPPPPSPVPATTLLGALAEMDGQWMWDDLQITGDGDWLREAIQNASCLAVTDGSYMEDLFPDVCSAAFIFECQRSRATLTGSFTEKSSTAGAYRGEAMGLMAIHLILAGLTRVHPALTGEITIYSDCKGALGMAEHVPTTRIPTRCKHSDTLKNIMVNCSAFPFTTRFTHVKAHQDDHTAFHLLDRPSQLNCLMDSKAKQALLHQGKRCTKQYPFPLEPITIFAGPDKLTSDAGNLIRFWAQKQLARSFFPTKRILSQEGFDKADWPNFYQVMHTVPRLFQLWACKQIMSIAGTNKARSKFTENLSPLCPSCNTEEETCSHILTCTEQGRTQAFESSVDLLDEWLGINFTDPALRLCITQYAKLRGQQSMEDIVRDLGPEYHTLGKAQDMIGWRRFMEGMITTELGRLQQAYMSHMSIRGSGARWARGLILKLLECSHGQWLYRNVMVHDKWSGSQANLRKETLMKEIEEQLENDEALREEDQYLMEINLGDISVGKGFKHEYWLLAVRAARVAKHLAMTAAPAGIG